MLNERLKAALDSASALPPEVQDKVAAQIESALRNARWDAQLNDPQYDDVIRELIAAAEQEEPLPFPKPEGWTEADDEDDAK
jgi:hypothetical protein